MESRMVFSMASWPYLSTSARLFGPWVDAAGAADAAVDAGHALDEVVGQHVFGWPRAERLCIRSMPSQEMGVQLELVFGDAVLFQSFFAPPSARPPLRANIRP